MTTVHVLAALLVIAALFFGLRVFFPNWVKVIPHRPEPRPGGGITWKVDFQLYFRSRAAGYVVQHINIRERMTFCEDPQFAQPSVDKHIEFWEAWPVDAGARIPHDRAAATRDFDDAFSFGFSLEDFGISRRGRARLDVRATVRFCEGVTLPNTFRVGAVASAGHALSDTTRPPFWHGIGAQHNLTYEWHNCGPGEPRETFNEFPKFVE